MGMRAGLASLSAAQAEALREAPDDVEAIVFTQDRSAKQRQVDLDKAWHGIHWLLTGDAWAGEPPLAWAILGGEAISDDDDMEYGPARVVKPEQVREVAAALAALDDDALARRYDPAAMDAQQIYPGIWTRDGQAALDYLRYYFHILARFYSEAAERGDAALQWIA